MLCVEGGIVEVFHAEGNVFNLCHIGMTRAFLTTKEFGCFNRYGVITASKDFIHFGYSPHFLITFNLSPGRLLVRKMIILKRFCVPGGGISGKLACCSKGVC